MKKSAVDIIYEMETQLLKDIISLLEKGTKKSTELAEWKLQKYKELSGVNNVSLKTIKRELSIVSKEASDIIHHTAVESAKVIDNSLTGALPDTADERLKAVWSVYENETRDEIMRLGAILLRKCNDMYVDVIEKSTAEVLAGQTTLRDAIRKTSKNWVINGMRPIVDKAGRTWTTEAYTQMVIRSGVRKTTTDIQIERLQQYGHDLVEISSHIGARPLCAPYQGRIYSLSGNSEKYPALSETSKGQAAGLFGINCGHRMDPYIEGTTPTYKPYDEKENDKVCKESQKQRYYERQIRKWKRIEKVYKRDVTKHISYYESKIEEMPRTRRYDREEIYD